MRCDGEAFVLTLDAGENRWTTALVRELAVLRWAIERRAGMVRAGGRSLDHAHEFVERRCHPQVVAPGVDAKFVVAPSEILNEGVATKPPRSGHT